MKHVGMQISVDMANAVDAEDIVVPGDGLVRMARPDRLDPVELRASLVQLAAVALARTVAPGQQDQQVPRDQLEQLGQQEGQVLRGFREVLPLLVLLV